MDTLNRKNLQQLYISMKDRKEDWVIDGFLSRAYKFTQYEK